MIPFQVGLVADPGVESESNARAALLRELQQLKDGMPSTRMLLHVAGNAEFIRQVENAATDMGYEVRTVMGDATRPQAGDFPPVHAMFTGIFAQANMLVAVCANGAPTSPGSAAWAARAFSEGDFPGAQPTLYAPPDCGAAVRISVSSRDAAPVTIERLAPSPKLAGAEILSLTDGESMAIFQRAMGTLDRFNAVCAEVEADPQAAAQSLLPPDFLWQRDKLLTDWLSLHARAEAVCVRTERARHTYLLTVVGLSLLFTLGSLAYGSLFAGSWPLAAGLASLTAAAFLLRRYNRQRIEECRMGARVLAECLRIGITLRAEGLPICLHGPLGEEGIHAFDWVGMMARFLDREAQQRTGPHPGSSNSDLQHPTQHTPARHWIRSQLDYFMDGADRLGHHARAARASTRRVRILVALAITGNLLTFVVDLSGGLFELNGVTQVTTTIMFLYWALLAIAAMVSTHGQIKGHEEHHAEYSKSIVKFRAADQLLGADGPKGDESLILALAAAAAREIATWLRVHRVRPLRILL